MKVWVVGGGGTLGACVSQRLRDLGIDYVATGRAEVDITRLAFHIRRLIQSESRRLKLDRRVIVI